MLSGLSELTDGSERLETTDDEQSVDLVLVEAFSRCLDIFRGKASVRSDFGTTLAGPAFGIEPSDVADRALLVVVVSAKAGESVVKSDRGVASIETVCDNSTGGRVHATGWGTNVDDTDALTL